MKSGFPYLVDVKITERCPFGCKMCYQSSTKEGKDADANYLKNSLPTVLRKVGVFEVAFGGGEPTLYQDDPKYKTFFHEILESWKNEGFIVGFTTKNYNLHKTREFYPIVKNTHSIAISVNSIEDVKKSLELEDVIKMSCDCPPKIYFQIIFGLPEYKEFQEMISLLKYRSITLLGYKRFGFGEKFEPHVYPDSWIEELQNEQEGNISADSVMIQLYREELLKAGVPERWLVGREGESTCYIDAVKKRIYPSSFSNHPGFSLTEEEISVKKFLELFQQF